ncbi:MAG: hypothetical protein VYC03_07510 [Pseudomonadota bacterium]|nr:hypothetical protein [Pseudomonadota bacterium]
MSTISNNTLLSVFLLFPLVVVADDTTFEVDGHSKSRVLADVYPANSTFEPMTGKSAGSLAEELRINLSSNWEKWTFDTAWQLYGAWGDRIELLRGVSGLSLPGLDYLQTDDRRLLNLTSTITDNDNRVAFHRLDRLTATWSSDKLVVRIGRQAITWGNGLVFSPMDIVNPFDPTAVDTEYKPGDDMVYGQYLRDNGDDIEFAQVYRQDPVSGDTNTAAMTTAVKYHGFAGQGEYDVLVSKHHDETTIGIGGNRSVGGAVVHGDIVWTDGEDGSKLQLVTNVSYSWVWGDRNVSGMLEYYYNGFGQPSGHYGLAGLSQNRALIDRLQRGETFTLGRKYLAGGLTIEMSPLWMLTPNLFANLDDGSALFRLVTRNSLGDDAEFLGAVSVPIGPAGSEFGGLEAGLPGLYLATSLSLFAQFSFYV